MSLPMQKAKYIVRAVAVAFGVSSKGNYQIAVTGEVADGELMGDVITWIGHFTERTQERTIESLQHFGWKGDDLSELENLDEEACARLLPDHVEYVCEPDTYEGETTLKVKWVNRPGAGRFAFKDKLEGSQLKAFAAQMKGAIRGAQQGGGSPRNGGGTQRSLPNAAHPNAPGSSLDDDLPF